MKENNSILNSRSKSIGKALYTFFVIALPALLIWIFFSKDFPFVDKYQLSFPFWINFLISLAFILGTFLITLLFIYFKILDFSILMFSLPVSLCLMVIFLTNGLVAWARALIIIPFFICVVPIGILVKKIEQKLIVRKHKKINDHQHIIGHKK